VPQELIATVISQRISIFISLVIIKNQKLPFNFSFKNIIYNKNTIIEIIKLGLPISVQELFVCISFLAITAMVNSLCVFPLLELVLPKKYADLLSHKHICNQ